jgi:hypothetical protein
MLYDSATAVTRFQYVNFRWHVIWCGYPADFRKEAGGVIKIVQLGVPFTDYVAFFESKSALD